MKRYLLTLALIATTAFGADFAARANQRHGAPTRQAAAPAPAWTTNAPTLANNALESVEAYFQNGDPTAPLQGHQRQLDGELWSGASIINTNLINSQGNYVSYPGAGHNAWLLTSTALVLFMTLPGLALFYGGLVRKKNVLSVLAQCFLITGLMTILWVICSYGMIFGGDGTDRPWA